MTSLSRVKIIAVAMFLLTAMVPGKGFPEQMQNMPGMQMHHGDGDSNAAFMAGMEKMNKNMSAPMSGDTDKDFVMMMIPHHQGAIDMAKVELQYGKDAKLRSLAKKIVKAQESEIAYMKEWQSKNK